MSKVLGLICEDKTDYDVFKTILSKRYPQLTIVYRKTTQTGINRLVEELENLVRDLQKEYPHLSCIAVLHDADKLSEPNREKYKRLKAKCEKLKAIELVARDELEAWLLADSGVCQWLDIPTRNYDTQRKPSEYIHSEMKRKKQMSYQGINRQKLIQQIAGDGDERSPSMKKALVDLQKHNCL
jgi:hypothetical protein